MEAQGPGPTCEGEPPLLAPPGWYPGAQGVTNLWDGRQWGAAASAAPVATTNDPRSMAVLAQALGILTGWLGPLIIYRVNGEKDPFVRHHAAVALNFHLTVLIAYVVSFVLMFVLVSGAVG